MKRLFTVLLVLALLVPTTLAVADDYSYVIGHYGGFTGAVATAGSNGRDGILLAVKL